MGFSFRKSIRLGKGMRLNIGMKSTSISMGGKGYTYTSGTSGDRVTVGIPGSGLSYTKKISKGPFGAWSITVLGLSVVIILALIFGRG